MASVISHPAAVVALAPWFGEDVGRRACLLAAVGSILPDADVVGYWLGIPYGSPLGHRGLTHSLFFAAVLSAALAFAVPRRRPAVFLFLFLCVASHGLLDAMTDGGRGIAFFAPLTNARFHFPWRPIPVSPLGVGRFLSRRGLLILESELLWIWLPALALFGLGLAVRASGRRNA
jgi:inner membrane protein